MHETREPRKPACFPLPLPSAFDLHQDVSGKLMGHPDHKGKLSSEQQQKERRDSSLSCRHRPPPRIPPCCPPQAFPVLLTRIAGGGRNQRGAEEAEWTPSALAEHVPNFLSVAQMAGEPLWVPEIRPEPKRPR